MHFTDKLDRRVLFAIPALVVAGYLPEVIDDAMTYRSVIAEQHACCGFVSESRFERPVTYALVEEWTQPIWKENAIKTERWLTSEGKVNGETKFWRLLEQRPATTTQE